MVLTGGTGNCAYAYAICLQAGASGVVPAWLRELDLLVVKIAIPVIVGYRTSKANDTSIGSIGHFVGLIDTDGVHIRPVGATVTPRQASRRS